MLCYFLHGVQSQTKLSETLLLSHEAQKVQPCFPNSFLEGSLGASLLFPDTVSGLCLKDYICTINTLYHLGKISKLSMLLITCRESVVAEHLSASRTNLGRHSCWRADPGRQPAAVQWSSASPGPSTIYRGR